MNKFVIEYNYVEPYVFSFTESIPVLYDSKDKLEYDLYQALLDAIDNKQGEFNFLNHTFDVCKEKDFENYFSFYTIDEWFDNVEKILRG